MIIWKLSDGSKAHTGCAEGIDETAHADELLTLPQFAGASYVIEAEIPQADADKIAKEGRNAKRKAKLLDIDATSARAMREFIIAKFGADPLIPNILKTRETAAAAERAALEP